MESDRRHDPVAGGDGRLQLALDAAGLGSFAWYPDEGRGEPDARMMALFGLPPTDAVSLADALARLIHPDDRARYAAAAARALDPAGSGELREEVRVVRPNGAERWLVVTARTEFAGALRRAVRVAADITDRKWAEERQAFLVRLGDQLRPLSEPGQIMAAAAEVFGRQLGLAVVQYIVVGPDGDEYEVAAHYGDGRLPRISAHRGRVSDRGPGWGPQFRAGRDIFSDDHAPRREGAVAALGVRSGSAVPLVEEGRLVAILATGHAEPRRWTEAEKILQRELAARTWAAVERARAEATVRASAEQFRRAIADAPIPILMQAEDGEVLQLSRTWTELTGYALADIPTADAWLTRAYGPGADALRDHAHELFDGARKSLDVEFAIRTKAGADRHWSFNASAPGRLRDGRRFLVGMAVDITERKQAEGAARAGEELARAVAANLPNAAAFVLDRDLRYTLAAGEALSTAGFTPGGLKGKSVADVIEPELVPAYTANYRQVLAGEPFRTEHVRHDRHYGTPLRDAAGRVTHALAVSYDITDRVRAEEGLRASEERFRLLVANARDHAIFAMTPAGAVATWNEGAERVLGYAAAEAMGRPTADFFTPHDREMVRAAFDSSVRRGKPLNVEFRVVWPDGAVRWLQDQGDVFNTAGGPHLAGACVDVTELKQAEAQLRAARDDLELRVRERTAELAAAVAAREAEIARRRELTRRRATAQEDERRRVVRDLHDSLGQLQAGLAMGVAAVRRISGLPEGADERLADVQRLADELARETHALATRLRPTSLDDLGLGPALAQLTADWAKRTGLPVDLQTPGLGVGRLTPEMETAVYRMVQESLTNVARHSDARGVSVAVTRADGRVAVLVEDDGVGFDPATNGGGRLGLLGMRERVELAGGSLEVESATGTGTTVFAHFPLRERHE